MATIEDRKRLAADMLSADYIATQRDRYLTFWVGGREYGIALCAVLEIRGLEPLTEPLSVSTEAAGVVDLRGAMVPVIDLRQRFGGDPLRCDGQESLIFVQVSSAAAGLVVDAVGEVVEIPGDLISAPDASMSSEAEHFVSGERRLGESVTAILDLERLLPAESRDH
jgi:purine-binding chemotaxis protein CheW